MYQPNQYEQRALARLEHPRQRLLVQRLLEVTDPHCHPIIRQRVRGVPLTVDELSSNSLGRRTARRVLITADEISDDLLQAGGGVDWQRGTFRSYLLDRRETFTGISFAERLNKIRFGQGEARASEDDDRMRIRWAIGPAHGTTRPVIGGGPTLLPATDALGLPVRVNKKTHTNSLGAWSLLRPCLPLGVEGTWLSRVYNSGQSDSATRSPSSSTSVTELPSGRQDRCLATGG